MRRRTDKIGFGGIAPSLRSFVLFEIAFLLAYRFGMSFTQSLAAPFWFPDSILLCAFLLSPPSVWWMYIVGALPIRMFLFVPPGTASWFLFACFANDSLKAVACAWLLRPASRQQAWFSSLREFTRYLLVAVLLVPVLSAFAGAAARAGLGYDYWPAWKNWFFGDALAALVSTPLLLCLLTDYRQFTRQKPARYVEALVIAAGLILTAYLSFHSELQRLNHPPFLLYLPVPFLLWAAVGFGPLGASATLFFIGMLSIFETIAGRGPFLLESADGSLFAIQLFLFFVSFPFMFLSVIIHQQRRTEAALRESEERFRNLANTAPVMVWVVGTDARCTFCNKPWLDFTGRSLDENLGDGWLQSIHPDDRETCERRYLSAFESRSNFTHEYRVLRQDGVYRWVFDSGVPRYGADGVFLGYIGSCVDLTERRETEQKLRELSAQLVCAQEAERSRIGQQLHDDLAQRVFALSMGLSRLAWKSAGNDELEREFQALQDQAVDICKDIAHLSHQLRPVVLERLGLPVALRSLCEQATTRERLVLFIEQEDGLPRLTESVSVSLYRIAQEALRNALTHSRATHISIELSASKTAVRLCIKDKGCGFAVDSASRASLGLSGMAERMKNAGGELVIRSSSGNGTTVTATIPIARSMAANNGA